MTEARWWFYCLVRAASKPAFLVWFRLAKDGLERVPREGGLIVAANHVSYLDPAVLGSVLPRPARFIMFSGIWKLPVMNWFFRAMRSIPVDREGTMTRSALRAGLDALARGEAVAIFPEGGRVRPDGTDPALLGVALLARRSGAQVVPVGIDGTQRAMPIGAAFPRPVSVRVRFGEPLAHAGTGRAADEAFTTELMSRIRALAVQAGAP